MLDLLLIVTVFIVAILTVVTLFGKKKESNLIEDTSDDYKKSLKRQEESLQIQKEMLKTASIAGTAILSLGLVLGGCLASSAVSSDDAERNQLNEEGSLAVGEGIDKIKMDSGLMVVKKSI
ncbi:hypothetical protein [Alkalihalobacillus sp. 1P02AB]|uniref:hypothetical protein n=1 Tax=Alkalihalobacillus sp. 1P02AB TaxID=3132260 RepID=UPI0039A702C2